MPHLKCESCAEIFDAKKMPVDDWVCQKCMKRFTSTRRQRWGRWLRGLLGWEVKAP